MRLFAQSIVAIFAVLSVCVAQAAPFAFVESSSLGDVSVIDVATNQVVATAHLGGVSPEAFEQATA